MDTLIANLFAFPTALFSVGIGIALLYWLLVIVGACDLDLLDPGDHDPHAGHNPFAILEFLRVGQVPLTIIASIFVAVAWVLTFAASTFVRPLVPEWSWWGFGLAALVGAISLALPATRLATGPLARLFAARGHIAADSLIGRMVLVTSTSVDTRFGTARHDLPSGEDLLLNVVCAAHHRLSKGEQAVVMEHDRASGVYTIAPLPHTRPGFLAEPAPPAEPASAPVATERSPA